jgi:hypothetical protein
MNILAIVPLVIHLIMNMYMYTPHAPLSLHPAYFTLLHLKLSYDIICFIFLSHPHPLHPHTLPYNPVSPKKSLLLSTFVCTCVTIKIFPSFHFHLLPLFTTHSLTNHHQKHRLVLYLLLLLLNIFCSSYFLLIYFFVLLYLHFLIYYLFLFYFSFFVHAFFLFYISSCVFLLLVYHSFFYYLFYALASLFIFHLI